jgi:hypothetical protein
VKREMESSGTTPIVPSTPPETHHSSLPLIGGILLLLAGVMGLIQWALILVGGGTATLTGVPPEYTEMVRGMITVCAAIGLIFSLIAFLGGFMAIKRKMWGLSLVGSILGLFTLGFVIGSVLALVALILIAISKKEFT